MSKLLEFVLCEERHRHPDIDGLDFVYPNAFTTDVLKSGMGVALKEFKKQANGFLHDVLSEHHFQDILIHINLYVTGLTPAFAVFVDCLNELNHEIFYHYDDEKRRYEPLTVTYFFYDKNTNTYANYQSHWNGE